jgi:hypothetical protein
MSSLIRPVSHINEGLDQKPPTREEYEILKERLHLLQQKNKLLKQKVDSFSQIIEISQEDTQGIVTDAPMYTTTVFPLMKTYHQSQDWPERTNVFCWWDCHPFNTPPIPLPVSYNRVQESFKVHGCFCSIECALAYKKSDRNLDNIDTSLLYFFFNKIVKNNGNGGSSSGETGSDRARYETRIADTKPAPPRQTLSIFGGHFNIDEFRKFSKDRYLHYDLVTYPLVPIAQYAEVKKKKDPETIKKNQLTQPSLKLKRTKPLLNHKNTLENSMGLNVKKIKTI